MPFPQNNMKNNGEICHPIAYKIHPINSNIKAEWIAAVSDERDDQLSAKINADSSTKNPEIKKPMPIPNKSRCFLIMGFTFVYACN